MLEACQEISRGLSERQRAQPPGIRNQKRRTPTGCEESSRPYRVRFSLDSLFRWYALKSARVPPANVHARLRRAQYGYRNILLPLRGRRSGSLDISRCPLNNPDNVPQEFMVMRLNTLGSLAAGLPAIALTLT